MTTTKVTLKKSTNEYDEQIYLVLCDGIEIGNVYKDYDCPANDGRDWENDAQGRSFWTRKAAVQDLIFARYLCSL